MDILHRYSSYSLKGEMSFQDNDVNAAPAALTFDENKFKMASIFLRMIHFNIRADFPFLVSGLMY